MKKLWLLTLIPAILALFYFGTLSGSENTTEPVKQPEIAVKQPSPPTVEEIYRLVNEERAKVGVAPLKLDERLNQSAQEKVNDMVTNNYFAHANPTTGVHGYTLIDKYLPECKIGSENLLANITTSRTGIDWWLNSPSHKAAILNQDFALTGVAVKNDYVVQHFCRL